MCGLSALRTLTVSLTAGHAHRPAPFSGNGAVHAPISLWHEPYPARFIPLWMPDCGAPAAFWSAPGYAQGNASGWCPIRFDGVNNGRGEGYKLISSKTNYIDKENNRISSSIIIPETPPSKKEFDDWVQKCLISSASNHYQKLLSENSVATKLGSIFSTQSTFEGQIRRSSTSSMSKGIAENAIDCVLKMQLPCMAKVSAEDLMSVRTNDGEEFKNFRVHLEGILRELRTESDPNIIKNKIIDIEHELSAVQVRAINSKVKTIRRTAIAEVGITTIGLVAVQHRV